MLLEGFYSEDEAGIHFTREQASRFAKEVAGDFNPLHDVKAKRFCVPGDLLFSVVLAKKGLQENMAFKFSGMVVDDVFLDIQTSEPDACAIIDKNDKEYLSIRCEGNKANDEKLVHDLIYSYVAFSGKTFPHILVPLLEKHQVMINPARPMVIYESMAISLDTLSPEEIKLEFDDASLEANGKRGTVHLMFNLLSKGKIIGRGEKKMLLSGLQPFDQAKVTALVDDFNKVKTAYDPTNPTL